MMKFRLVPLLKWLFIPKELYVGPSLGGLNPLYEPELPAPPDYKGAAEATAAGDLEAAKYATEANRPDLLTPWGSSTWEQGTTVDQAGYDAAVAAYDPDALAPNKSDFYTAGGSYDDEGQWQGQIFDQAAYDEAVANFTSTPPNIADFTTKSNDWTNTVALSPEQQALMEQGQATDLLQSSLAHQGLTNTEDLFSTPFKTGLEPIKSYEDQRAQYIQDAMSRINTDVGRDRATKEAELIAQGIPKNSPAFDVEMERFDRRLTDAGEQANLFATQNISTMGADDRATRGQTVQEAMLERQTPLNELNALRTGTQVSMPQFNPFAQQTTTSGPDYMGAALGQSQYDLAGYNAETAQKNAMLTGIFGLGAAKLGAG